jgi:hypothetical protein
MNTNFPLKVVCPKCQAAVSAKCTDRDQPLDPQGFAALKGGHSWVDWFHFERIEKAKEAGFNAEETA